MSTPPGPAGPGAPDPYYSPAPYGTPASGTPNPYGTPAPYSYGPPPSHPDFSGGPGYTPQRPPGTNGFAIAALVFGIIGGFILGFIFGFIALTKTKKTGQAGRGMAIAGLILSGVWTVIWAVLIIVGVFAVKSVLDTSGAPGFGLKPGDCFNHAAAGSTTAITPVSCSTAHDGETVAIIPVSQSTYPDEATFKGIAQECLPAAKSYLDPTMDYPNLGVNYVYPQQSSWTLGNHAVVCFVGGANGRTTGTARSTGTPAQH